MNKKIIASIAGALLLPAAFAAPGGDVIAPIHQFIDGFNTGDTKSAYAAYASGSISIIDEFAPHLWVGKDAAHAWADVYAKHAESTGVSDGNVKYGDPIQEEGQMTFVLHHGAGGWKIQAWTWTGVKPHPAK